jgi:hypothetical protein
MSLGGKENKNRHKNVSKYNLIDWLVGLTKDNKKAITRNDG